MIDRLRRAFSFPVVCALGLLGALHGQRVFVQPTPSYGCCSAGQILGQAERLCRVVVQQGGVLRLSVDHTADGASVPQWTVEVSDEAGTDILHLGWDAVSGELARVSFPSQPSQKPLKSKGRRLTDREVVRAAWSWMQVVGFAAQGSEWRLAGAPETTRGVDTVTWKSRNRVAEIQLGNVTGNLVMAQSWRSTRS